MKLIINERGGDQLEKLKNISYPISVVYELDADGELGEGELQFYIGDQDICSYKADNKIESYSWNLFCIVTWLCENIDYIIGYDPFPLPVHGDSIQELIEEADKFESEDEVEEYLWYNAKSMWMFKHNWFSCREGSILTLVYFRRVGNNIEIYWDNDFWKESDIEFQVPPGNVLVNKDIFKEVITKFVKSFLDQVSMLTEDKEQIARIEDLRMHLRLID